MHKPMWTILWLGLVVSGLGVYAQGGDSQAGQCENAIPVCEGRYSLDRRPGGANDEPSEINGDLSCLRTGEKFGVWYRFTADRDGFVSFLITPNQPLADYDWAVYDLTNATCADIRERPELELSCNFSGTPGPTGADGSTTLTRQDGFGTPFNDRIPVVAGGTYVLYVSSFDEQIGEFGGYVLRFNLQPGEPLTTDQTPPELHSVSSPQGCTYNPTEVRFNEYIACTSIALADFELETPEGDRLRPTELLLPDCEELPVGLTLRVGLRWPQALSTRGAYTLRLVGEVADACGNLLSSGTLRFEGGGLRRPALFYRHALPDRPAAIVVVGRGGQRPYEYSLNGGPFQASSRFTGLVPGTYRVAIRDRSGCAAVVDNFPID